MDNNNEYGECSMFTSKFATCCNQQQMATWWDCDFYFNEKLNETNEQTW